ncbi:hypothetical protein [Herbaspirillum autotrophicum]|nr:hypothetical protein [Herbaspirillum autotrophicum]
MMSKIAIHLSGWAACILFLFVLAALGDPPAKSKPGIKPICYRVVT